MKKYAFAALFIGTLGAASLAQAQYVATPAEIFVPGQNMTKTQIWTRIHNQIAKVNADSKVGKLTTDQANVLLASVQAIKDQVKADYVENGKKELTNDQKVTLSSMLDQTGIELHSVNGLKDYTGK
jgi:hypothetical protein